MIAAPRRSPGRGSGVVDHQAEPVEHLLVGADRVVEARGVDEADPLSSFASIWRELLLERPQLPGADFSAVDHRLPGDARVGEVERGRRAVSDEVERAVQGAPVVVCSGARVGSSGRTWGRTSRRASASTPSPRAPLVKRWLCAETKPGATNAPPTSSDLDARRTRGASPSPIDAMRPSSTCIQPSKMVSGASFATGSRVAPVIRMLRGVVMITS